MTTERFMVDDAGTLIDMHTRDTFDYVSDVCGLLNELHEELKPIHEVCDKYNIPIKDLPEILEEYIAYDNDDDW